MVGLAGVFGKNVPAHGWKLHEKRNQFLIIIGGQVNSIMPFVFLLRIRNGRSNYRRENVLVIFYKMKTNVRIHWSVIM